MQNTDNTVHTVNTISDDYYDNTTYTMLLKTLTDEDNVYMNANKTNETTEEIIFTLWRTIINSFPHNYYTQYASQNTSQERNDWFQRYLDLPTKDMALIPEIL